MLTKHTVKTLAARYHATRPTPGRESYGVWENMMMTTGAVAIPLVWEIMFYNACKTGEWDESLNGLIE